LPHWRRDAFRRLRACGEVGGVHAGEAFVRLHPTKFGNSAVPLALELIEAERVADDQSTPPVANVRMGVEMDIFGRAQAYWVRESHPGDLKALPEQRFRLVRVPADQMIHLRIVERWPQARGEPWLHSVLRKLNDMEQYSGSELTAARMSANYFATLERRKATRCRRPRRRPTALVRWTSSRARSTSCRQAPSSTSTHRTVRTRRSIPSCATCCAKSRPVPASRTSRCRAITRSRTTRARGSRCSTIAICGACCSNGGPAASATRCTRCGCARRSRARHPVHHRRAVRAGADAAIEAVRWKFRGWSWVDPTKEVEAYREAVRCGFTTTSAVIAQTAGGLDIEDVLEERAEELKDMAALGLVFDTDPSIPAKSPVAKSDPPAPPVDENTPVDENAPKPARVVSIAR
jgi:capsid protein